jgi:uncharacterized SAM-binding protein YcdF (DUF218 family)
VSAADDVLVVLGAALRADGELGPALAERVEVAAAAFHRGAAPCLIMTGAVEAEAMRRRAVELGVPEAAILVEKQARTTRENALATAALMRRHGLAHALLVTQRFHRPRSLAAFRRAGVAVEPLQFDGRPARLKQLVREAVALLVYAARGWL